MIVVADTSPLSYLIRLGHLEVVQSLYGDVAVPPAVLLELLHPNAPPDVRECATARPPWLKRIPVERLDKSLPAQLGAGEREAISLALELKADILLIDDWAGRRQAEMRGIPVAGTLAVLLQASLREHLRFPEALERLRQLGFRSSAPIEAAMLARYDEAKCNR